MLSPDICWNGLSVNRSGFFVQSSQMYSYGIRPLNVLSVGQIVGCDEIGEPSSRPAGTYAEGNLANWPEPPDACELRAAGILFLVR